MLYTNCTMHIHTHTFITSLLYELGRCHLYDVVIITTNARWLIGDCLSCYTCFWWVAGIQTHTAICKTIENMSGAQKYHAIYLVFDFAASYMYASRKIEESGNWDETFLTRHMRLSVYQACNKSLHWAMPSLWHCCSCSPLTSCFWCSCIRDLIINYLSE